MAEWLAGEWDLDLKNREDRRFYDYEMKTLDRALAAENQAEVLTALRLMYDRLRAYRALRGRVHADETLDDWLGAVRVVVSRVVAMRLSGRS